MLVGNLVQAVGMRGLPLVADSLLAVRAVDRRCSTSAAQPSGAPSATSSPRSRRRGSASCGSASSRRVRNLGFAVGGVLAGVALQIGTDAAYQSVVVVNAVTFVLAFVLLLDVPDHRVAQAPTTRRSRAGASCCATAPTSGSWSASSASWPG